MNATALAARTAGTSRLTTASAPVTTGRRSGTAQWAACPDIPVTAPRSVPADPAVSPAPTLHAVPLALPTRQAMDRLAEGIAADGITAHEAAVTHVLAAARTARLNPVLVAVLADPREPAVARGRAFGRIAVALARV
jgi:hypothetical protein